MHLLLLEFQLPKKDKATKRVEAIPIRINVIRKIVVKKKRKAPSLSFFNIPMKALNHYKIKEAFPPPTTSDLSESSKGFNLLGELKNKIFFPRKLGACNKEGSIIAKLAFDKDGHLIETSSNLDTRSLYVKVALLRQLRKIKLNNIHGPVSLKVQFIFRNNSYPETSMSFINKDTLIIEVLRHDLTHHTDFRGAGGSHCPSDYLNRIKQDRAFTP
jgi:hypothetical protein